MTARRSGEVERRWRRATVRVRGHDAGRIDRLDRIGELLLKAVSIQTAKSAEGTGEMNSAEVVESARGFDEGSPQSQP